MQSAEYILLQCGCKNGCKNACKLCQKAALSIYCSLLIQFVILMYSILHDFKWKFSFVLLRSNKQRHCRPLAGHFLSNSDEKVLYAFTHRKDLLCCLQLDLGHFRSLCECIIEIKNRIERVFILSLLIAAILKRFKQWCWSCCALESSFCRFYSPFSSCYNYVSVVYYIPRWVVPVNI